MKGRGVVGGVCAQGEGGALSRALYPGLHPVKAAAAASRSSRRCATGSRDTQCASRASPAMHPPVTMFSV